MLNVNFHNTFALRLKGAMFVILFLQIQLDNNKSQLTLALQKKEMINTKLSEVSELRTFLETSSLVTFYF